jgi:predicted RNase H-like nuclease (RuvC/YqgF family)
MASSEYGFPDDFSDDDQQRPYTSAEQEDEQHAQKVNGQIEKFQVNMETLEVELINERKAHEETRQHLQSRIDALQNQLEKDKIEKLENKVSELQKKLTNSQNLSNRFISSELLRIQSLFQSKQRPPSPSSSTMTNQSNELTNEQAAGIFQIITKEIDTLRNPTSTSGSLPSVYLRNEFVKFATKFLPK